MTDKQETNAVQYDRLTYLLVLKAAAASVVTLETLRDSQIEAWKADTDARNAEISQMLEVLFTQNIRDLYRSYLRTVEKNEPTFWQKLFRITPKPAVDAFGSAVAFAEEVKRITFPVYCERKLENLRIDCDYGDVVEPWEWVTYLAENGRNYKRNVWNERRMEIEGRIADVERMALEGNFIIPRSEFDAYAEILATAESGELWEPYTPRVKSKLESRIWYNSFCE